MDPIFVLCGGGRTGSTLLQRLLISTRQTLIWGEHRGLLLPYLFQMVQGMRDWARFNSEAQFETFRRDGHDAWIPIMNPESPWFVEGCRKFLDQALGEPARRLGYPRWGFKEIRYGGDAARFLQELFPGACFLFAIRDPADCLRSIKATRWYPLAYESRPEAFLRRWVDVSRSLADLQPTLPNSMLLRYEDFVRSPDDHIRRIAALTAIPQERFDLAVLERKERGTEKPPQVLDAKDRAALADPEVRTLAERFGYGQDAWSSP
jgi:hypothetical protein